MKKINEASEALMRIPVLIVSGLILNFWRLLVTALAIVNFFIVLIAGKRNKEIAEFSEIWSTQTYAFLRYMTFNSNDRPFPFRKMSKNLSSFEK